MDRLIDEQSEELDRDKRLKRVWEIQRRLEADVARPMLGWRTEHFTRWPYVKNLVPHNSLYNYARTQQSRLGRPAPGHRVAAARGGTSPRPALHSPSASRAHSRNPP